MGIEISKPFVYLGNKKIPLKTILKNKSNVIKNKIGSKNIHIEENKSVLEMGVNITKKCIKHHKSDPKFLILVSQGQEKRFPSFAEEMAYNCGISNNCFVFNVKLFTAELDFIFDTKSILALSSVVISETLPILSKFFPT